MLLRFVPVVRAVSGVDARAGANRSDRRAAESIPPAPDEADRPPASDGFAVSRALQEHEVDGRAAEEQLARLDRFTGDRRDTKMPSVVPSRLLTA